MLKVIKDFKTMIIDSQIAWVKKHKVVYAIILTMVPVIVGFYYIVEKVRIQRIVNSINEDLEYLLEEEG